MLHNQEYEQLLGVVRNYKGFISTDTAANLSLRRPIAWIFTSIQSDHSIFKDRGARFRRLGFNFETEKGNTFFDSTTGVLRMKNGQWDVVIIHLSTENDDNRILITNLCRNSTVELPHVIFFAGPAVHLQQPDKETSIFAIVQSLYSQEAPEPMIVDSFFGIVIDEMKNFAMKWKKCPASRIEKELESSDFNPDQLQKLSVYPKPIEMNNLAWDIAKQKGEAIAWFTICEVLGRNNLPAVNDAVNGDCLLLCLEMIIQLESPGRCYQLVLPTDKENADAMSMKLTRIFLQNNLVLRNSEKGVGSVKLTYEGSWLEMWRLTQIAKKEDMPFPIKMKSSNVSTETRNLSTISLANLKQQLENKKQDDRQWVIIFGANVMRPSRRHCLLKGFELLLKQGLSDLFRNRMTAGLVLQSVKWQSQNKIDEKRLEEWIVTYQTDLPVPLSAEENNLLEVFAASEMCQLFGTAWWKEPTDKIDHPVELISQLSSKRIALVTQDWHEVDEQLWGFESLSVEEAIKGIRTGSVYVDMEHLVGKVVHLLGSFSQPETLLPTFASSLMAENSAAFLLGLFNSLKKYPELRIAIVGTDEDEEMREGLTAYYRSTRPDLELSDITASQSLQNRIFFFTSSREVPNDMSSSPVASTIRLDTISTQITTEEPQEETESLTSSDRPMRQLVSWL